MIDDKIFESVDICVGYLKRFDFSGIAFSGGEPLLEYDRLIRIIQMIRDELGLECYIWLYTNGDSVTEAKLSELAAVGLKEIRFNLTEKNYFSEKLELAVAKIPTVTVEIPAIPEDVHRVSMVLEDYTRIGVNYINLNQLSLNRNNEKELAVRGYSIINGSWVIDSELAALKIMRSVVDRELPINISFCSQAYKKYITDFSLKRRFS